MKHPFGKIKDGRRRDIFSIIINNFPIIALFEINFRTGKLCFNNPDSDWKVKFFYILGFHIYTSK